MSDTFDSDWQEWVDGDQAGAMPAPAITIKSRPVDRKPPPKPKPSTSDVKLFEQMGASVREAIRAAVAPLEARIKELESTRPEYKGVWEEGVKYKSGALVSHAGSMWHANTATTYKPGTSSDWTLAVKRGRDAKKEISK